MIAPIKDCFGGRPSIYIGVPTHDGRLWGATAKSVQIARTPHDRYVTAWDVSVSSLLPTAFAKLFIEAKINKFDYFCMLHSDVAVRPAGWAVKLVEILEETGAEVVSATSPMKGDDADLSTAVDVEGSHDVRRITIEESERMPEVFNRADVAKLLGTEREKTLLLLNTACWVCRTSADWYTKAKWGIRAEIDWGPVTPQLRSYSEDWELSRQLAQLGYADKLYATRRLRILHMGANVWGNYTPDLPQPGDWAE